MKVLLPFVAFLVLAVTPLFSQYYYPVYAEDSTSSSKLDKKIQKLEDKRNKALEKIEERREKIGNRIEDRKEKIASKAAALKEKLLKFKDKKKAARVEKINENLAKINERRTEQMAKNLARMEEILAKLEEKLNENTSSQTSLDAISDAKTQINTAKAGVDTQSKKDYTIVATSEAKIKDAAMEARNNLHVDLKAVHGLVVTARKAVSTAISTVVSSINQGVSSGQ